MLFLCVSEAWNPHYWQHLYIMKKKNKRGDINIVALIDGVCL